MAISDYSATMESNDYVPNGSAPIPLGYGGFAGPTAHVIQTRAIQRIMADLKSSVVGLTVTANTIPYVNGSSAWALGAYEDIRNLLDAAPYVPSRTALKALTTANDTVAILTEAGREGVFQFKAGDYSTEATADTLEGVYVVATDTASTSGCWVRIGADREYRVEWFGAVADGATDDGAAINAAIALSNTLSGPPVQLMRGTHIIGASGSTMDSQSYGILVKSGVTLRGHGSGLTTLKAAASSNTGVITNDRTTTTSGERLIGFTVDGNYSNTAGYQNIWLMDATDVVLEDIYSKDCDNLLFRLEAISGLTLNKIKSTNANTSPGSDGCHLYDCSYVTGNDINVSSNGDDGFAITAYQADTHDIVIDNLVSTAPVTGAGGGRGILLNLADASEATSTQRSIYNVKIRGVTHDCKGPAVHLVYAQFRNIDIDVSDYGSKNGLSITVGSANVTGYVRQCDFKIKSQSPDQSAMAMTVVSGTVERNRIDLKAYDPGDGYQGAIVYGSFWDGSFSIDYDPGASKVSATYAIDWYADSSNVAIETDGGTTNLNLRATATNNTFHLGKMDNAVTYDIATNASASDNSFIGGYTTGAISDSGSRNRFTGNPKFEGYGLSSGTTDANGNFNIAHGLAGSPKFASVNIQADSVYEAIVESVDATNIKVRVRLTTTNADAGSISPNVYWHARI